MKEMRNPTLDEWEEATRSVLAELLVGGVVDRITYEIETRAVRAVLESWLEKPKQPPKEAYVDKGNGSPVYRPEKPDAGEARALAKGVDPLTREELTTVLDQGGYLKMDAYSGRISLFEGGGEIICYISPTLFDLLEKSGAVRRDHWGNGYPRKQARWIGA